MRPADPRRAAERVARLSYGRLVALLAARSGGDLASAEDALGDALARALERWPCDGVPANPEGWLMTAARRRLIDAARMRGTAAVKEDEVMRRYEERAEEEHAWPEERLMLLYACTHPAVPAPDRTPLMLQVVLGLPARRIAGPFLTTPAAMGQRLSRAKARIAAARSAFEAPAPGEIGGRTADVLAAVYAAATIGAEHRGEDAGELAGEALWLASLVADLVPDAAEAHGLLALILFVEARRDAGRDGAGAFVPLDRQDPGRWDAAMLADAEAALRHAGRMARPGRFQIEASIQAVHAARRTTGRTDWEDVALLYEGLVALSPTLGALTARAVALGEARGAEVGLGALDAVPGDRRASYQPWWAARGHLLAAAGRASEARDAFLRAAGLATDPAIQRYLAGRARRQSDA